MLDQSCSQDPSLFELRFDSLCMPGRALVFPCDAQGDVDLDRFTERVRCNYLFARAMLGREYAWPRISACSRS